jgi:hypothetical protein
VTEGVDQVAELAAAIYARKGQRQAATEDRTVTPASKSRPATVVGGWTVTARPGRVWLHPAWPDADGDLTPDAAETLAAALLRAAVEARRPLDRSWTPTNQGR